MDISAHFGQPSDFKNTEQVFVIQADEQTLGKGQAVGSTWTSPPGNLYATLVVTQSGSYARFTFNFPQLAGVSVV